MNTFVCLTALLIVLCAPAIAQAKDPQVDSSKSTPQFSGASNSESEPVVAASRANDPVGPVKRHGQLFFGLTGGELHNASGFDVDYSSDTKARSFGLNLMIHLDKPLKNYSGLHRRYSAWTDSSDFDGLALQNVGAGAGLAFRPMVDVNLIGLGFSVGGGAGLQYAETFLDNTIQGFAEVNAAVFVRLWIITVQLGRSERVSTSNTLDERTASPRITSTKLSLGISF